MEKRTFSPATIIGLFSSAVAILMLAISFQIALSELWRYDYDSDSFLYRERSLSSEDALYFFGFLAAGSILVVTSAAIFLRKYWGLLIFQIIIVFSLTAPGFLLLVESSKRTAPISIGIMLTMLILAYAIIRWCNAPWVKPLFQEKAAASDVLDQDLFQ